MSNKKKNNKSPRKRVAVVRSTKIIFLRNIKNTTFSPQPPQKKKKMTVAAFGLVAIGAMDHFLTGDSSPAQTTYFRSAHQKHTNFAMEHKPLQASTGAGQSTQTFTLAREADLVHEVYVRIELPELTDGTYVDHVGFMMIESAKVKIGGTQIDKITNHSLLMWEELTQGTTPLGAMTGKNGTGAARTLYVPLNFWFCKDISLSLPLVSLSFHSVKIELRLADLASITVRDAAETAVTAAYSYLDKVSLVAKYIYLDKDERTKFAKGKFEILIPQHQHAKHQCGQKFALEFNHPVSQLMWCVTPTGNDNSSAYAQMTGAQLTLNGQNRFTEDLADDPVYFNQVIPHSHYPNIPSSNVYAYPFAINPADTTQPSGTLNFSRIDNVSFKVNGSGTVNVCGLNWNLLRYSAGMCGVVYAN